LRAEWGEEVYLSPLSFWLAQKESVGGAMSMFHKEIQPWYGEKSLVLSLSQETGKPDTKEKVLPYLREDLYAVYLSQDNHHEGSLLISGNRKTQSEGQALPLSQENSHDIQKIKKFTKNS